MNNEYNPLSFKSKNELSEISMSQQHVQNNYLKKHIIAELHGNEKPCLSVRFNNLKNLHQLFPSSFFTERERIEWEMLESASFEITHGQDPENISMRLKLEHINQ